MDIKELLKGIIVIIDDKVKISNSEDQIKKIISKFEEDNFPIVAYDNVPDIKVIDSLSSASFIILDWDLKNRPNNMDIELGERIYPGESVYTEKQIKFIKKVIEKLFVPLFIFTNSHPQEVESVLKESHLEKQIGRRIFIKQKGDLEGENLYTEIENWMNKNPAAYVVKEWDKLAIENRNNMFLELYECEADWPPILGDTLSHDSDNLNTQNEFGEFLTRNFCNRFHSYEFNEKNLCKKNFSENDLNETKLKTEGISKILKLDAFIDYKGKQPPIAYTGDIFKSDGKYYLNLRAQCDIIRKGKNRYCPELYCIEGSEHKESKKIVTQCLLITNDKKLKIGTGRPFDISEILDYDKKQIKEKNNEINNCINDCIDNKCRLLNGALLERNNQVLLLHIIPQKILVFDLKNIHIKKFRSMKKKRIGRIVPPYITKIQQKFANFIIRQGTMPIPEELYKSSNK